jgi:hypothetical protein
MAGFRVSLKSGRQANAEHDFQGHGLAVNLCRLENPVAERFDQARS